MRRFAGNGQVLRDGEIVARVRYQVVKTGMRLDTEQGLIHGLSSISGSITNVGDGSRLDMDKTYMLRIEGGKELEFSISFASTRSSTRARYQIMVNGDPEP